MSDVEQTTEDEAVDQTDTPPAEETKRKLDLSVQVSDAGPCRKHLKVTIPRTEIEFQFDDSLKNFRREAMVPGFRVGRAPRTLIEKRFRKEVAGQVKSTLLMACMEQIDTDHKINPISQPELDVEALQIPDDGPLEFEFDVEVQPDFALPEYKDLVVKRPVRKITDRDVDAQLKSFLERYAQIVPKLEGGAALGDYVVADLTFSRNGIPLNAVKEIQFRLQPELRFQDGVVPDLAKALVGVKPNENRIADAQIGPSSPDPNLRGQKIQVEFKVHDLKTIRLPEADEEFLNGLGFDSMEDLKQALREILERRVEFQARQAVRRQIVDQLVQRSPFDLPPALVRRQVRSTTQRLVAEMREAGYSDTQLKAREAEIRANAHDVTLANLKEFFLLSKIGDAQSIKVEDSDISDEIDTLALRGEETPRRIRARLEREGRLEDLSTQVLERKVIDHILEYITVEFEEVSAPAAEENEAIETLNSTAASAEAVAAAEAEEAAEDAGEPADA
jgi:trigger factor